MPVFAHPTNVEGARIAIDSGVDVPAHTIPESPPWTRDFTQQLKRANVSLIPTLTPYDVEARKAKLPTSQAQLLSPRWSTNSVLTPRPAAIFCLERMSGIPTTTIRR
jgi:hypothetical protein